MTYNPKILPSSPSLSVPLDTVIRIPTKTIDSTSRSKTQVPGSVLLSTSHSPCLFRSPCKGALIIRLARYESGVAGVVWHAMEEDGCAIISLRTLSADL